MSVKNDCEASYIIWSGSNTYYATNGTTGKVDYSGSDATTIIEQVWIALGTLGGGTIRTKGPGETWTINSRIDSQGGNVTWISDISLRLRLANSLNVHVIYVTHDHVTLDSLYVDGNGFNQTTGSSASAMGIYYYNAGYGIIKNCRLNDVARQAIDIGGTAGVGSKYAQVLNNMITQAHWNGIGIFYSDLALVQGNIITGSSDVGIATWDADNVIITNNILFNNSGTRGGSVGGNSNWDIGIENTSKNILISSNYCSGSKVGISIQASSEGTDVYDINVTGNYIYNEKWYDITTKYAQRVSIANNYINSVSTIWYTGIYIQSTTTGASVVGNYIYMDNLSRYGCRSEADDLVFSKNTVKNCAYGLECIDGDSAMITDNRFIGCTTPIDVNDATINYPMIMGNNWQGCTNDATTAAAVNERITANIDKNGAWWATGDSPA